jgi:NAD-dependent dihydropyrimidine dehydrogenase PreA subunit
LIERNEIFYTNLELHINQTFLIALRDLLTGSKMVELEPDKCMLCGGCVAVCPTDCITVYEAWMDIDQGDCTNCGACVKLCPVGAMEIVKVKA